MNLKDRNTRKEAIRRYLDAETTPEEERDLCRYFAVHSPDNDEKTVARLLSLLEPDTGIFDILSEGKDRREKARTFSIRKAVAAISACAAVAAIVLFLLPGTDTGTAAQEGALTGEIAAGLLKVMEIDGENITSVSAVPFGNTAIVTADMADGKSLKYIMSYDNCEGAASFIALNDIEP